jgi:hypothetical protein
MSVPDQPKAYIVLGTAFARHFCAFSSPFLPTQHPAVGGFMRAQRVSGILVDSLAMASARPSTAPRFYTFFQRSLPRMSMAPSMAFLDPLVCRKFNQVHIIYHRYEDVPNFFGRRGDSSVIFPFSLQEYERPEVMRAKDGVT